ncbi:MAG TPA: alpha/beta fold hydrolase [Allosphingosinicella sp.]|nr:alpha/beta fold hydrolase [Allosphingosinicella sp.]
MTRRRKLLMLFVLLPVALYAVLCAAVFFLQTALVFPVSQVPGAGPPPPGATRLQLAAASGERLHGLHVPPRSGAGRGEAPVLLGFGGNGWNGEDMAAYLHDLHPEAEIVVFHYRGYPPSEGSPGAEALRADALLVFDWTKRRFPDRNLLAVGFSIGSGVAAHLADRRPLDGAILVTPFDSLAAAAADHYPWLPVRLLFRHEMAAAEDLRGSRVPVAIVSGERDTLILPARSEALRRAAGNLAYSRVVAGAGHNDIYQREEFRTAMHDALRTILRR